MSRNATKFKRLRDACERLRDVAAVQVAESRRQQTVAQQDQGSQHRNLTAMVDDASARLREASNITDLELLGGDIVAAREALEHAQQGVTAATASVEDALTALRDQERQLRTTERVLEQVRVDDRRIEDKREQRNADDSASRNRRTV